MASPNLFVNIPEFCVHLTCFLHLNWDHKQLGDRAFAANAPKALGDIKDTDFDFGLLL